MNRRIELAKKKRTDKALERSLSKKNIKASVELKDAVDRLNKLLNGKQDYDFARLEKQLTKIDKHLDLSQYFTNLERSIENNSPLTHISKTKIQDFSKLLEAVKNNKPIETKIDLDKLEKAVVNIEQYIRDNTEASDQGAEKYKPYRRVVKVGNRFMFDDNLTSSGGGGGIDTSGLATSAKQDTQQTSLDSIKTSVEILDNAISGSEMQVDTVSAVSATLDHGSNRDIDTSAEQITSTSFACKFGVTLKADMTNTGIIYVGNSDVTAGTTAATDGFPLSAGETVTLEVTNANIPYAIASANNQIIYWVAV